MENPTKCRNLITNRVLVSLNYVVFANSFPQPKRKNTSLKFDEVTSKELEFQIPIEALFLCQPNDLLCL